ncbi:MAG: hypothetical protein IH605_12680 [Burkholderiales bacterium]|nr:hypothetical protein [Burkholderiales bacterium]
MQRKGPHQMAESAHYQQLGKFVILFQELENSLIELHGAITGKDYAVEILPAETGYPRLARSTEAGFSDFIDRLRDPDPEARTRFHELTQKCLDIGLLRNRLIRSTYALLERTGDIVALVQQATKLKLKPGSRRQLVQEELSVESFEPYFQRIADVLAELESFRLQVIAWKSAGKQISVRVTAPG